MTLPEDAPARNAKTEVWAYSAQGFGIVAGDMGRDEIIEAVLAAQPDFQTPPSGEPAETWTGDGPDLETKGGRSTGAYFDV